MLTAHFRDTLGRKVREAWIDWAVTQPDPKPSWLVPYDDLCEADKEADRQIGERLFAFVNTIANDRQKIGDSLLIVLPPGNSGVLTISQSEHPGGFACVQPGGNYGLGKTGIEAVVDLAERLIKIREEISQAKRALEKEFGHDLF